MSVTGPNVARQRSPAFSSRLYHALGTALQPVLAAADTVLRATGLKEKPQQTQLPTGTMKPQPATSEAEMEAKVARLASRCDAWVQTGTHDRVELVRECMRNMIQLSEAMARTGMQAKGGYESGHGEEWSAVIPVVMAMAEYCEALAAHGIPEPLSTYQRPDGQWVARVWPKGMMNLLLTGFKAEVWMMPGYKASQGKLYRNKATGSAKPGGVALVLGAGNQLPVVCLDILHKLLCEDEVVIAKMNPVNDYLGPLLEQAFGPFVREGYVEFAYGGAAVGKALVQHPTVEAIHLTGSNDTYNAIVWGSPTAPRVGTPPLNKRVTAELGNVTPYIIVPGKWTQADLQYHVDNVMSGLANNASHNCLALELLVTAADWPQRDAFLSLLRKRLDQLQQRVAYYPGSDSRHAAFLQRFPQAEALGRPAGNAGANSGMPATKPWLMVTGLHPDEAHTDTENWCGVFQEVAIPGTGSDAAAFLEAAAAFANERAWGSLACSITIDPATQRQNAQAFDAAIAALKYGSICINCPTLMGFCTTALPWGAFPGNTPHDIRSGDSFVHNTSLFDHPQKGVLYGPWRMGPRTLWSVNSTNLKQVAPATMKFVYHSDNALQQWRWALQTAWSDLLA